MGKIFSFFLGLIAATSAFAAEAVDEDQPHGRVCFALFEPGPPEKEEAFQVSMPPNGWRPQLSEVPEEFEEILLPKAPCKTDRQRRHKTTDQ